MNSETLQVLRLVLAGVNGLLFAVGVILLLRVAWLTPRRWRQRLAHLLAITSRDEEEVEPETQREIEWLREKLSTWRSDPRILLNLTFSAVMIAISIFALLALSTQPWSILTP